MPTFGQIRDSYRESDAWLLDREGVPLQRLRIDLDARRLPWVRLADVSPAMVKSLLVSEDKRFYEHGGIDWNAVAASAWGNLWSERRRGASTLTMQLAGMLIDEEKRRGRRNVFEKVGQAAGALQLERSWRKDEILEAYLNLTAFRGELRGVGAMSTGLFGKDPDSLEAPEAALAVALLRNPAADLNTVALRACPILKALQASADCDTLAPLARLAFSGGLRRNHDPASSEENLAPHLARKLLKQPGERVVSTLDAGLQRFATDALRRHLRELARQNVTDGAVLVLDNASGEVRAWVGSSAGLSSAPEVDSVIALRQAGSTLKPFLYGLAFDKRMLTPATLLEDAPTSIATANGLYIPQDYAPEYRGWVSVRQALGGSLNVPAVHALERVGLDAFFDRLRAFGFRSLKESGDYYGYSLALGSADISPLMLANAYRTLANGGHWTPLRVTQHGILPPCQDGGCAGVFGDRERFASTPQAAFLVSDILADRTARASTFGMDSWLATPYWTASKTGTSKDMRDNWCAGFSARHTVVVWVGNASGEAMHDVSGTSGAAPIWREIMDRLAASMPQQGKPSGKSVPPSVVRRSIRFEPPREPPREEWFLAGTEVEVIRLAAARSLSRIAYPGEGTILALDPDIPPSRQRVALRLSGAGERGWRWRVDNGTPMAADRPALWLPVPGKHRLALLASDGREADVVNFHVRALKASAKR